MSKKKHNLIVVAHPDDETIFFGGLILASQNVNWEVVCVTDGNADKHGKKRMLQFKQACELLGVTKTHFCSMPDIYSKRLDIDKITTFLARLDRPNTVYTHSPIGEYGHPHHQDVSWAVHNYYLTRNTPVWAPAYNCHHDKIVRLSLSQFNLKNKILSKIYFTETKRFIRFLPATSIETYAQFTLEEARKIYTYLTKNKKLTPNDLIKYKNYAPYLALLKKNSRPF